MNTGMELTTRAYRSRRGKIGATLAVVVGALVVLGSTAALAASGQASPGSIGSAGFQSETLRVEFTDGSGRPTHTPEMSLTGAVPGMAPTLSSINLSNTGTLPAAFTLSATNLQDDGSPSLDGVLVVTVRSAAGQRLYRGMLSGLALTEAHLEPGQARTYDLSITWPATPNDNDYQGLPLTFGLQADATAAQ